MKFFSNPSEKAIQLWGELAYLDEDSRKELLNVSFGKYKEAQKAAIDFVKRKRVIAALREGKFDESVAARVMGVRTSEFKKMIKDYDINIAGLRYGEESN